MINIRLIINRKFRMDINGNEMEEDAFGMYIEEYLEPEFEEVVEEAVVEFDDNSDETDLL